MKKVTLKLMILASIFLSYNFAQSQTQNRTQNFEENGNCVRKRNLSFKNRVKNFPFNLTTEIIIVSHKNKGFGSVGQELIKYLDSVKIGQDTINEKEFFELKKLNLNQINELTDIIYNYGFKAKNYSFDDIKCYEPRNAIIFLDKENKVIAFFEICFDCQHIRTSDEKIDYGEYCEQKFNLIKKIFQEVGIKYGITEKE